MEIYWKDIGKLTEAKGKLENQQALKKMELEPMSRWGHLVLAGH